MCCKGLFKRLVPFFLAFAVGLFIASFFVSIAAPSFNFRGMRERRRHEMQQLMMENNQLRDENLRLQDELDTMRRNPMNLKHVRNMDSEPKPGMDFPPPPPPQIHR